MIKVIPELSEKDKARFWSCVAIASPDECWLWLAATNRGGYGRFTLRSGSQKCFSAHRIALAILSGEQRPLLAMHSCDNPPCCNPAHLSWGTVQDNSDDMVARGRAPVGEKSGRHTHPETTARGEKHGLAKLTEEDVRCIRVSKEKQRIVAAYYGVAHSQIGRIRRRQIWKHVTDA